VRICLLSSDTAYTRDVPKRKLLILQRRAAIKANAGMAEKHHPWTGLANHHQFGFRLNR
jgi:hypothetical protein